MEVSRAWRLSGKSGISSCNYSHDQGEEQQPGVMTVIRGMGPVSEAPVEIGTRTGLPG